MRFLQVSDTIIILRVDAVIDEILFEMSIVGIGFPDSCPGTRLTGGHGFFGRCHIRVRILVVSQRGCRRRSNRLTPLRLSRLGPPCLAKRLSSARSIFSLPVDSGGRGVVNPTVLRSNSPRARGVSHNRDKLSQNQLGVRCRGCFSSFCRLVVGGGEESVVGSVSTDSFRFRLWSIGVLL